MGRDGEGKGLGTVVRLVRVCSLMRTRMNAGGPRLGNRIGRVKGNKPGRERTSPSCPASPCPILPNPIPPNFAPSCTVP